MNLEGKTITVETEWLLANDYGYDDFKVGQEWLIVFTNKDGDVTISYLELLKNNIENQLRHDDFELIDGDEIYQCTVSKIWPFVTLKIEKHLHF